MGKEGKGDIKAPNFSKDYERGIKIGLKYLPRQLAAEYGYRQEYDPKFIEQALGLQHAYDPSLAREQLAAVQRRDPEWVAAHKLFGQRVEDVLRRGYVDPTRAGAYEALGKQVTGDTLRGTTADPATLRQMTQAIMAQRPGLSYGEAQDMATAVYVGQRGQGLQQQRQQAANQFLGQQSESDLALTAGGRYMGTPTMTSMINQTPGVTPPSALRYVNPNAGYQGAQYGLQNFQNTLAANQMAGGGGSNPWMQALQGAATGASYGSVGGVYGAAGGLLTGAVAGGLGYPQYSTIRLKTDIEKIGEHNGLDIVEFSYIGGHCRYRGVIAEQVQKEFPDAVVDANGLLKVDYVKLGIPFLKRCNKCRTFKDISEFPPGGNGTIDGHYGTCKACMAQYMKEWQQANSVRSYAEARRLHKSYGKYKANGEKSESARAYKRKWQQRNRDKLSAHHKVWWAVNKSKILVRQPCWCGAIIVHAHHPNGYENALDVIWLCPTHHREIHKKEVDNG